jgi:hypothetical protein
MNHASVPTDPADPHHTSRDDAHDAANRTDAASDHEGQQHQRDGSAAIQTPKLSKAAKDGLAKKLQFLIHLSLNMDTLVYAELCVLYYLEFVPLPISCSPLRFIFTD